MTLIIYSKKYNTPVVIHYDMIQSVEYNGKEAVFHDKNSNEIYWFSCTAECYHTFIGELCIAIKENQQILIFDFTRES